MKAVLGIVSLLLTIAAVMLTGQVMKPPVPIKDRESKPDPVPLPSERVAEPSAVSAKVADSDMERFYRQNLFHPDRRWVDPAEEPIADPKTGQDDGTEVAPPPSDAENFELVGILKIGERATAVIRVLPPKPKPVVRARTSRGIPIRTSRTPTPPKPSEKVGETTHVYALGKPIEETGYTLTKVELESVELTHDTDQSIITLNLDKLDDGSKARRKGAQTAAVSKAKAQQAKVAAAQRAAQQKANVVKKLPPSSNTKKGPTTPSPKPPTATSQSATAQSAEERAKRLEQIREQFRKRLEERRNQ